MLLIVQISKNTSEISENVIYAIVGIAELQYFLSIFIGIQCVNFSVYAIPAPHIANLFALCTFSLSTMPTTRLARTQTQQTQLEKFNFVLVTCVRALRGFSSAQPEQPENSAQYHANQHKPPPSKLRFPSTVVDVNKRTHAHRKTTTATNTAPQLPAPWARSVPIAAESPALAYTFNNKTYQ